MEALRLYRSAITNEHKTTDILGQGPLNINLSLFFVVVLMFIGLPNHFRVLADATVSLLNTLSFVLNAS